MSESKPKSIAEWNERYIARWLGDLSPQNRSEARRFDLLKVGQGKASSTRRHYALALRSLDASTRGKLWTLVDDVDVSRWLAGLRQARYTDTTIKTQASSLKVFLRWTRNEAKLPPRMIEAFRIRERRLPERPVLTLEEEQALLNASNSIREQAMIAVLTDAGFRLGELVNLNVVLIRVGGSSSGEESQACSAPGAQNGARLRLNQKQMAQAPFPTWNLPGAPSLDPSKQ